jgi:imidazolonepropionase-like amidohydrolase/Tol biopolymer transport system component
MPALRPWFVLILSASACARPALPGTAAVSPAAVAASRPVTVTAAEFTKVLHDVSHGDGGIVFDAFGQLWQVPSSGGEAQALTRVLEDSAAARDPRFSPDGHTVLYGGDEGLRSLTLASGGRERLPGTPPQAASWHPGGEALVGVRWDPAPGGPPREQLIRYELATGALTPIPAASLPLQEGGRLLTPAWSVDGQHVAVTVIPSLGFVESGSLWEIEVGTGAAQRLLPDGWVGRSPAYSPDGEWLAFVGGESEEQHQVHVLRRADGSLHRLTSAPETATRSLYRFGRVAWTPDGAALIYAWEGQLAKVALDGGEPRDIPVVARLSFERREPALPPVTFPAKGSTQQARGFNGLALSPDGERVALLALERLWIVSAEGRVETSHPVHPAAWGLSWSPDGAALVWSAGPRGDEDLFISDARTGGIGALPALSGREIRPTWSPDGRHIVFYHYPLAGDSRTRGMRAFPAAAASADEVRELGPIPPIQGGTTSPMLELQPQWTADGRAVLIHVRGGSATVLPLEGESSTLRLPGNAFFVRWLADDSIVFIRDGRLHAARVPLDSGVPDAAVPLTDGAAFYPTVPARDGSVLYVAERGLVIRRPDGRTQELGWPVSFSVPVPEPLLVRSVRLFDPASGTVGETVDLLVTDGRVTRIAPAGSVAPAPEVRVLEAGGRIALPGLVDAHTHPADEAELRGMLYYGVTSTRTMGGHVARTAAQRDAVAAGAIAGPRLVTAGFQFALDCSGDECNTDEWGYWPRDHESVLRALALEGAFGGGVTKLYYSPTIRSAAELVDAAQKQGLRVAGHFARSLPQLAAGMHSEEHTGADGFESMQGDHIALVAAAGLPVTSTMVAFERYLQTAHSLVDAEARAFTTRTSNSAFGAFAAEGPARNAVLAQARLHRHNVGRLHAAGALIAAGTDAPGLPAGLHDELERLVAVGLTPAEALTAATFTAARVLGAEAEIGRIAPGYRADLLILDADPLADIRNTRRIHTVIQGGSVIDRERLRGEAGRTQ